LKEIVFWTARLTLLKVFPTGGLGVICYETLLCDWILRFSPSVVCAPVMTNRLT